MIDRLDELIDRLDNFETEKNAIISEALSSKSEEIVGEVREQLWNGLTNELKPITPSYLNDPYFKTKEQAYEYMMRKQSITPNERRPMQTPNLFINGYFHNSLFLSIDEDSAEVTSMQPLGDKIIAKYGREMFGVNDVYIERNIIPLIEEKIKSYLNGTI